MTIHLKQPFQVRCVITVNESSTNLLMECTNLIVILVTLPIPFCSDVRNSIDTVVYLTLTLDILFYSQC